VKLQLTDSAALVAVTVTRAPEVRLETEIEGVESLVRLSVLDTPESDSVVKSGAAVLVIETGPTAVEVEVTVPPRLVPVAFTRTCRPTSSAVKT
jgi:hypothetical protein